MSLIDGFKIGLTAFGALLSFAGLCGAALMLIYCAVKALRKLRAGSDYDGDEEI